MFDEGLPNLRPISFFQLSFNSPEIPFKGWVKKIAEKKYKIPDASFLCAEDSFAEVYMGWSLEGLHFLVHSKSGKGQAFFPDVTRGDSAELFIDTRDIKTSGVVNKFCHHFFFLPNAVNDLDKGEITRFRTEDSHELCTSKDLFLESESSDKGYELKIFIPAACLYGYDPREFNRLGFTYRINRLSGAPQHFSVISEEFPIEQQPSLWASANLI